MRRATLVALCVALAGVLFAPGSLCTDDANFTLLIGPTSGSPGRTGDDPNPIAAFDYYVFAAFWPPASIPAEAQGRARHIIHEQVAAPSFWTHGLWPAK